MATELRFPVKLDDSQAAKELNKLESKIGKLKDSIAKAENARAPIVEQLKEAQDAAVEAYNRVEKLKAALAESEYKTSPAGATDPDTFYAELQRQEQIKAELAEQEKIMQAKEKEAQKLEAADANVLDKLKAQTAELAESRTRAGELSKEISFAIAQKEKAAQEAEAEAAAQMAAKAAVEEKAKAEAAAAEKSAQIKDAMNGASKRLSGIAKKFVLLAVGAQGITALMRRLREVTISAVKSFAENDPETKASIDNLKASLATLKASWGAAFAPVLNAVVPILQTLISWLTSAVNAVARFFAILGGKNSYKKAVASTEKLADNLGGVAANAKEAKKQLMGIDTLNVMSDTNTGSSGGGGGGGGTSGDEFIDVPIDANDIWKKRLEPIRESLAELSAAFDRLKNSAGAKWFMNFLKGLGETALVIGINLVADWLKVLADTIDYAAAVLNGDFHGAWEAWKRGIVDSVNMVIHPLETLSDFLNQTFIQSTKAPQWLKDIFNYSFNDFKNDVVAAWEWSKKYLNDQAIMAWLKKWLWDDGILAAINDIKPLFTSTMRGLDQIQKWYETNVRPWFTAQKWAALGKDAMNSLISAIKAKWQELKSFWANLRLPQFHIQRPVFSWIGQFSLNPPQVPHLSLTWMAKGGIVDGATLIGAGEAGKEAIVPLERNTQWVNMVARELADLLFDRDIFTEIADKIAGIPTALDRMTAQLANLAEIPMPAVAMGAVVPPNTAGGGYGGISPELESKIDALLDRLSGGSVGKIEPSNVYLDKRKVGEIMYTYTEERNRGRGK